MELRVRWFAWSLAVVFVFGLPGTGCESKPDRDGEEAEKSSETEQHEETDTGGESRAESRVEEAEEDYEYAFPRNDWACTKANRRRVRAWLEQSYTMAAMLRIPELYTGIEGPVLESSPDYVVRVDDLGLWVQDELLGSVAEVLSDPEVFHSSLDEAVEQRRRRILRETEQKPQDPGRIGFAFHEEVEMTKVVKLLNLAAERSDLAEPFLALFPGPRVDGFEPAPEEVRKIPEQFDAEPPKAKRKEQKAMAEALAKRIEGCEPLVGSFSKLVRAKPETRERELPEAIASGWYACDCDIDLEFVVSLQVLRPNLGRKVVSAPLKTAEDGEWRLVVGPGDEVALEEEDYWGSPIVPDRIEPTEAAQ